MNGFTRQEALALTGITVGMLNYLDETGEVVPTRAGNPPKPLQIAYSVEQVIDLKIASVLRPKMLWKDTVRVIRFVRDAGYCNSVFQVQLATVNGEMMRTPTGRTRGCTTIHLGGRSWKLPESIRGASQFTTLG
jgi:hypothetical protein